MTLSVKMAIYNGILARYPCFFPLHCLFQFVYSLQKWLTHFYLIRNYREIHFSSQKIYLLNLLIDYVFNGTVLVAFALHFLYYNVAFTLHFLYYNAAFTLHFLYYNVTFTLHFLYYNAAFTLHFLYYNAALLYIFYTTMQHYSIFSIQQKSISSAFSIPLPSLHEGSLEITLTVPSNSPTYQLKV